MYLDLFQDSKTRYRRATEKEKKQTVLSIIQEFAQEFVPNPNAMEAFYLPQEAALPKNRGVIMAPVLVSCCAAVPLLLWVSWTLPFPPHLHLSSSSHSPGP